MSYIEKKYRKEINQIFGKLPEMENYLLELLNKKSVKIADNLANACAHFNKNINLILKKYYPEIKEMDDKLEIKSILKFYFDLIDKLTDFIRNIVNFRKIDENYYNLLIDFIEDKENLISGKYRTICTQELTTFYDPHSRENLEKIIAEKFQKRSRQFFTIGTLEEEIKKIAKIAGADLISIISANSLKNSDYFKPTSILESAESVINFTVGMHANMSSYMFKGSSGDYESIKHDKLKKILNIEEELNNYLKSKGYLVKSSEEKPNLFDFSKEITKRIINELDLSNKYLIDGTAIGSFHQFFVRSIITNAKLLPDNE